MNNVKQETTWSYITCAYGSSVQQSKERKEKDTVTR